MSTNPENEEIIPTSMELSPKDYCSFDNLKLDSCESFPEAWQEFYRAIRESEGKDQTTLANMITSLSETPRRVHSEAYELAKKDLSNLSLATQRVEMFRLLKILPKRMRTEILRMAKESARLFEESGGSPVELGATFYSAITDIDIYLGQNPRVYFNSGRSIDMPFAVSETEVESLARQLGADANHPVQDGSTTGEARVWGTDFRLGVSGTLHRVGVYLNKAQSQMLGCSIRVGRHIPFAGAFVADLMMLGSVLIIAPPCSGKTTVLRDAITRIANTTHPPRLVVVDTSDEIAGDSDIPSPYLAAVRRLHVKDRSCQNNVLLQAVQNHSPEIVVVDELAKPAECDGICTIIERGCRVLCSVHGESIASVMHNKQLSRLLGGAQSAILSAREKATNNCERKVVVERMNSVPFQFVLELTGKMSGEGVLYADPARAVDMIRKSGMPRHGFCQTRGWKVDLMKSAQEQGCLERIRQALAP
ncbi:R3H domain-containing protein [Perkinsela sp. CCAP 1560/4]|nr:R3H domain-containing protein [Perkinsela sp. CCAP 1560/4]|eukprot:KNH04102.1 R3H domain-containing protein [Perkinsela sp. CCAP 1560/4]